jgi:hypothetical protein
MTRANKAGPEHFPYKDDAIAVQKQQPRAGSVRMCWPPGPHAKYENSRPARRLTIEATIQL